MTNKPHLHAFPISPWRAEFIDPAMEQSYLSHAQANNTRYLRSSLHMWAIFLVAFGLQDWLAVGTAEGFLVLRTLGLSHAILLLCLSWHVLKKPHWTSIGWPVTIVAILGYPLFLIYPIYRPEAETLSFAVVLLLVLSMYVFIPNRVMLSNLIALLGIVGIVIMLSLRGATMLELLQSLLLMLWPALVGYAAALRINMGSRHAFELWQQAEQGKQRLEQQITHNKALETERELQALTDPLTGLSNRRHYEMLFKREHERCRRHGATVALAMIDLDHFKRVNDTYGHDVGDQVLRFVSEVMKRPLRSSDILGRFGGEEFILIMPDTSLQEASAVAERMRQALEESSLAHRDAPITVTATFGVTAVKADDIDIHTSIRRADKALYSGKRSGRNKVVLADAAPIGDQHSIK